MDKDYVIGITVPNFISIAIMAFGGAFLVMLAKKAVAAKSGGN